MYIEDFFIRHRQLAESADKVIGISQSQKESMDNTTILVYSGATGYKVRNFHKIFRIKRTKLLQSKSKQSRMVAVVCK